jgi:hypothetical protein
VSGARRRQGRRITGELSAVVRDLSLAGEDDDRVEAVALATGVIVGVMCGGHFHCPGPEGHVHEQVVCSRRGDGER